MISHIALEWSPARSLSAGTYCYVYAGCAGGICAGCAGGICAGCAEGICAVNFVSLSCLVMSDGEALVVDEVGVTAHEKRKKLVSSVHGVWRMLCGCVGCSAIPSLTHFTHAVLHSTRHHVATSWMCVCLSLVVAVLSNVVVDMC